MLRFSKKVEYALIALLHMARKPENELTSTKELSDQYHIPLELMGKVLQSLVRNGMVNSVQGVKGGYLLNEKIENLTISQVVRVVDKPIKIVKCIENHHLTDCGQILHCNIRSPMEILQEKLEAIFAGITVNDLKEDVLKDKINSESAGIA
ncbi:MAG: Rrf2 family transcriptional regulator [Calditrichota bacterium]|jgi:Rrf2 family protein